MWHHERECQTGSGCDQNAEQRIQESRGRRVKIGFLNTDKFNGMGQEKVKQFSAPSSKTSSIPLKNREEVRGGEEAESVEGQPGAGGGGEGQSQKIQNGQKGDKRFE